MYHVHGYMHIIVHQNIILSPRTKRSDNTNALHPLHRRRRPRQAQHRQTRRQRSLAHSSMASSSFSSTMKPPSVTVTSPNGTIGSPPWDTWESQSDNGTSGIDCPCRKYAFAPKCRGTTSKRDSDSAAVSFPAMMAISGRLRSNESTC